MKMQQHKLHLMQTYMTKVSALEVFTAKTHKSSLNLKFHSSHTVFCSDQCLASKMLPYTEQVRNTFKTCF